MSCAVEEQASSARRGRARTPVAPQAFARIQADCYAVVIFSEAGFGELKFEFGEGIGGDQDCIRVLADLARHLEEDAMNLGLFFIQQADEFVVLLDGFERLDKDGLSAGTGAVDDALHAAFLLDFYRDHETLAADGNEFILHGPAFGEFAQVAAEGFLDLTLLLLCLSANAAQFGGSAIIECAVGQDLVTKRTQEAGEILNTGGKRLDGSPLGAHRGWRLAYDFAPLGSAVGDEDYVADLGSFKSGSSNAGFLNQPLDVGEARKFEAPADTAILADFCR